MGTSEVVDDESKGRLWLLNGRKRDEAEEATLAVAVAVEAAAEDRTGSIFLFIFHRGARWQAGFRRQEVLRQREKEKERQQIIKILFFLFVLLCDDDDDDDDGAVRRETERWQNFC